jgi:hypothetical protein
MSYGPWREVAVISKLIKAALFAALVVVVVQSVPDIKRYMQMRAM